MRWVEAEMSGSRCGPYGAGGEGEIETGTEMDGSGMGKMLAFWNRGVTYKKERSSLFR